MATDYAAKYPHRVKSIVISSTLCYSSIYMSEFNAIKFTKSFEELDPDLKTKLTNWHGERNGTIFQSISAIRRSLRKIHV